MHIVNKLNGLWVTETVVCGKESNLNKINKTRKELLFSTVLTVQEVMASKVNVELRQVCYGVLSSKGRMKLRNKLGSS